MIPARIPARAEALIRALEQERSDLQALPLADREALAVRLLAILGLELQVGE
jgi:hypothetical protein